MQDTGDTRDVAADEDDLGPVGTVVLAVVAVALLVGGWLTESGEGWRQWLSPVLLTGGFAGVSLVVRSLLPAHLRPARRDDEPPPSSRWAVVLGSAVLVGLLLLWTFFSVGSVARPHFLGASDGPLRGGWMVVALASAGMCVAFAGYTTWQVVRLLRGKSHTFNVR